MTSRVSNQPVRQRRWFWLVLVLGLAGLVECLAWLGCRLLTQRGVFYQPQPDAKFATLEPDDIGDKMVESLRRGIRDNVPTL